MMLEYDDHTCLSLLTEDRNTVLYGYDTFDVVRFQSDAFLYRRKPARKFISGWQHQDNWGVNEKDDANVSFMGSFV